MKRFTLSILFFASVMSCIENEYGTENEDDKNNEKEAILSEGQKNAELNLENKSQMSVVIEVSQIIDRSVEIVFDFCAVNHVKNHPRWDSEMELEKITDGPIGVGTLIKRRNTHFEKPIDGTMEIIEFNSNHSVVTIIKDGTMEVRGEMIFESLKNRQTKVRSRAIFQNPPEGFDANSIQEKMQNSVDNIKKLIESETKG